MIPNCTVESFRKLKMYGRSTVHWSIIGVGLALCVPVGTCLNAFNIYMFSRPPCKLGFKVFLSALSLSDIVYLVSLGINQALPALYDEFKILPNAVIMLRFYSYPCMRISYTAGLWLLVLASVERFLVLWFPLKHVLLTRYKRAVGITVCVLCLSVLINFPAFFEFFIESAVTRNVTHLMTNRSTNANFHLIYHLIIRGSLHFAVPLIVIGCLSCSIFCAVLRARKAQVILNASRVHDYRTAVMVAAYSCFFVLCNMVPATHYILQETLKPNYVCDHPLLFIVMRDLSHALLALNATLSFFVYYVTGSKFRLNCRALLSSPALISPRWSKPNELIKDSDNHYKSNLIVELSDSNTKEQGQFWMRIDNKRRESKRDSKEEQEALL